MGLKIVHDMKVRNWLKPKAYLTNKMQLAVDRGHSNEADRIQKKILSLGYDEEDKIYNSINRARNRMGRIIKKRELKQLSAIKRSGKIGGALAIGSLGLYGIQSIPEGEDLGKRASSNNDEDISAAFDAKSDQAITDLASKRMNMLPFAAGGTYGLSRGMNWMGNVAGEQTRLSEERIKELGASLHSLNKEEKALGSVPDIWTLKSQREPLSPLEKKVLDIHKKKDQISSMMGAHTMKLSMNPAETLKAEASKLKWLAAPLGIAGAYSVASRMMNPDRKKIITDPETSSSVNLASKAAIGTGIGAVAGGLYRPVIKPAMNKFRNPISPDMMKEDTLSSLKHNETLNNINKSKIDLEDIGRTKKISTMGVTATEEANKAKGLFKKLPFKNDLRLASLGYGLLGLGALGSMMSASKAEVAPMVNMSMFKDKQLEKKSSFWEALSLGGLGHLAQNTAIKAKIHSGGMASDMTKHIFEGNVGRVNKSKWSAYGDGFISGTLNPDAVVIKKEMRELGKSLKAKGVDLENLSPEDNIALHYFKKKDFEGLVRLAPRSELARMITVGKGTGQTGIVKALSGEALKNINAGGWDKINKTFKEGSLGHFSDGMNGRIPSTPFSPMREQHIVSRGMNNALEKIQTNKIANKGYKFLTSDVEDVPFINKIFKRKKMPLSATEKLESNGRMAGLGALAPLEPVVAAWNVAKPLAAEIPGVSQATTAMMGRAGAMGTSGIEHSKTMRGQASDVFDDYVISPSLGYTSALSNDMGKVTREVGKQALSKNKFNKLFDNIDLKETIHSPSKKINNTTISGREKELGLGNLDKSLNTTDLSLHTAMEEAGGDLGDQLIKNRKIDINPIVQKNNKAITKAKEEAEDLGVDAAMLGNIQVRKPLSEGVKESNDYVQGLAAPGLTLGAAGLVSPIAYQDYQEYKKNRLQSKRKKNNVK